MHLFEEAEEGVEQEEMEEEPEYNYNPEELQYPDEYNPRKPNLELQYLSNEANIMEQAQSNGIERELFAITHTLCDCKTCTDWSSLGKWNVTPALQGHGQTTPTGALLTWIVYAPALCPWLHP